MKDRSTRRAPARSIASDSVRSERDRPPEPDRSPDEQIHKKPTSGTYYIDHPNAARGLYKIDKDRDYYYKVDPSEQKEVSTLLIGMYEPTELSSPDAPSITFDTIYTENNFPMVHYNYERQFFQSFGRLAWTVGGGLYVAQGNGVFAVQDGGPDTPRERFTLIVLPINIGLTYRLKFFDNQWVVPFGEGGVDGFNFAEFRDDDQNPALGAALGFAPAAHFTAGASISLGRNARSFLDMDREYGINALYLTGAFRQYIALSNKYDFTGEMISGGITAEY